MGVKTKKSLAMQILFILLGLSIFGIDINISPSSISVNILNNKTYAEVFQIENNCSSILNITLNNNNRIFEINNGVINVSLNTSYIENLQPNNKTNISFLINATDVQEGIYSGNLEINLSNGSLYVIKNLLFTINVTNATNPQNSQNTNTLDFYIENENVHLYGERGDTITKWITIRNNGTETLHNFRIDFDDLESDETNDDISDSDIDLITDDGFDLAPGGNRDIKIEIDIPNNIDYATYRGKFRIEFNELSKEYNLSVEITGGDLNIEFLENSLFVKNNLLTLYGKPGDLITDDNEFKIKNTGDYDVRDITIKADELTEEFTGKKLESNIFTFIPNNFDIDEGDTEKIEARVNVPDDTKAGNYVGKIYIYKDEEKLDTLNVKLKVIGDLYIVGNIELSSEKVKPGDNLEISFKLKNSGSSLIRNIKATAIIYDINKYNDDLTETTNTFPLNVGDEIEKKIMFNIPDDASEGSKTIELRITYDNDNIINEVKTFTVEREAKKVLFTNYVIRPSVLECKDSLLVYYKIKNFGSLLQDVKIITYIKDTSISKDKEIELDSDDTYENNELLNVGELEPGKYKVETEIIYSGLIKRESKTFEIKNCSKEEVIIKPLPTTNTSIDTNKTSEITNKKIKIFNKEFQPLTVYLGSSLAIVTILITILLFI